MSSWLKRPVDSRDGPAFAAKLSRDGKEVEKPPELIKLRVAVPGNAKKNDLLTIHTQLGQFDLNVPAAHNKTIEVEIPVEPAEAARLNGKTLTVSKLLLNASRCTCRTSDTICCCTFIVREGYYWV